MHLYKCRQKIISPTLPLLCLEIAMPILSLSELFTLASSMNERTKRKLVFQHKQIIEHRLNESKKMLKKYSDNKFLVSEIEEKILFEKQDLNKLNNLI